MDGRRGFKMMRDYWYFHRNRLGWGTWGFRWEDED